MESREEGPRCLMKGTNCNKPNGVWLPTCPRAHTVLKNTRGLFFAPTSPHDLVVSTVPFSHHQSPTLYNPLYSSFHSHHLSKIRILLYPFSRTLKNKTREKTITNGLQKIKQTIPSSSDQADS